MKAFEGKLVLVTGGSSGIGRALSRCFAEQGASIALVGRNKTGLEEAGAECRAYGARAEEFAFDLAAGSEIDALVQDVNRRFGQPVDTLVHAAAQSMVGLLEDVPANEIQLCIAANLTSAFLLARAVLPEMKRRRSGHFVFLTSGTAFYGIPTESVYSATKAGLERLAEGLRLECQSSGILVTVVSPGPTATPLLRRTPVYGTARPLFRPVRMADPDVVARVVIQKLHSGVPRIELSWRPTIVRWLSCFAPFIMRRLLLRELDKPV